MNTFKTYKFIEETSPNPNQKIQWKKISNVNVGTYTYGANPKRSYFLWAQQELYLQLDT